MVSEGVSGVMSACADFTQNAWKKDLCVNCQRPRAEHMASETQPCSGDHKTAQAPNTDSPKPAKRNSLMTKSWTILRADGEPENETEEDKWASMCLPVSGAEQQEKSPDTKATVFIRREHCYEDIEGETMKQESDRGINVIKGSKEKLEDGVAIQRVNDGNQAAVERKRASHSRSSSREKSPAPALRPKPVIDKTKTVEDKASKTKQDITDKVTVSPRSRKKLKKNQKSLSFVEDKPEIIGEDGGLDNLMTDIEEDSSKSNASQTSEILEFTEDEKEWALQALKNTIWNTEHIGETGKQNKEAKHSKEYEDVEIQGLLQPDRFANVRDCEPLPEKPNFGTFPLRTKSEKSAMDSMFTVNRLSTLSETAENAGTETGDDTCNKYDSVIRFLNGGRLELSSSPQHGKADLAAGETSEPSYDDPWGDKFAFDTESEMNLLDEIKGEIDLDASNAGFALVDLLNDVLAKYSTGTASETDSVRNLDSLENDKQDKRDGKEKSAELEAKMVTLAASLRKQRAKGRAPRPPSCPPDPPQEGLKSPAKQLELRAAQSKEPTFKMVPVGKPIGGNILSQSAPAPSVMKAETLPLSSSTPENMESYKIKAEKQKKGGGIGSFFSRILRRGRDSDSDLMASSETLVSQSGSDVQSDSDSQSDKDRKSDKTDGGKPKTDTEQLKIDAGKPKTEAGKPKTDAGKPERRSSKSSPQMKLKVLPGRPMSPKGSSSEKVASSDKKDTEDNGKDVKSSQKKPQSKESPVPEQKAKDDSTEKSSLQNSKPKVDNIKTQLSPNKTSDKEVLAVSPKSKEAPPLPVNPPREITEPVPKPRVRGNSDGGPPRSRPRTRDMTDGKARDTPNVPPPKPPVAAKPRPPAIQTKSLDISENTPKAVSPKKEQLSSTTSLDEEVSKATKAGLADNQPKVDPKVLRKRAKSPKRFAAPSAPVRSSMPNILADPSTSINSNTGEGSTVSLPAAAARADQKVPFAKELELKLSKEQHTAVSDVRKISQSVQPASPSNKVDMSDCTKAVTKDKDIPKTVAKETEKSKSASKDDLKLSPPLQEKPKSVTPETDSITMATNLTDLPIQPEKIELPKPAGNSRKSFLGKLNRKNRPPPPPSVKRTKSITESSVVADHHLKKIDLKDISGPVLITDMSSNKAVSRRNTISLGDDNPFLSGGSTSSGSTSAGEKCELSPRGSVENLYEFITSEAPTPPGPAGEKKNFYDPVVDKTVSLRPPSLTGSEGYLEPVRSANGPALGEPVRCNMADSATSLGAMTTSMASMVNSVATMGQSVSEDLETSVTTADSGDNVEISDERRDLLASQPIYEEINGYGKLGNHTGSKTAEPVGNSTEDSQEVYGVAQSDTGFHDAGAGADSSAMSQSLHGLPNLKSKDSFSSESDLSSANSSLSRPRPLPRKRPRQVGSGFEQYVAMNRPSVAVFLNEEQLREMLSKLTAMSLQTLREIYTQHEKCFTKENLQLGAVGPLKWHDFDIYGKPLHTSEKCIVYNAKLRSSMSPCQVMLLHSRPEITSANHPSLLKPTCIFTDSIPFSYLTDAFIRTSQILETCLNQSNANMAKCYIVVGLFDITESVSNHLNSIRAICENQRDFLRKVLFFVLQLLSAISHCLEQGHPLAEADFHDLYLISNPYCLGETVAFLPQLRSPEDQQIDTVCLFLEKFLQDMCTLCEATSVLDDSAFFTFTGVQKVIELLEAGVVECLPIVRSYTEFLLWGPEDVESEYRQDRHSNVEPKLSMWLEQQRTLLIHDFAKRVQHGARCSITDFYKMKFLLKASSGSLAECIRCHTSGS